MSRVEFAIVMACLSAGTGKEISKEAAEVYYDLLGDLPLVALRAAAKQALLEGQYPVFPPVGILRKLAVAAIEGRWNQPSAEEDWGEVRRAIVKFGYMKQEKALASLSEAARSAVEAIGWQNLCKATETEIARAQFCRTYDAIVTRKRREKLIPEAFGRTLDQIGKCPAYLEGPKPAETDVFRGAASVFTQDMTSFPAPSQDVPI